jgi:phosphoribosylformylglycinamidine cyclo-ligase
MGHRLELYLPQAVAAPVIEIAESFGVEARIVGRVEEGEKAVVIRSEYGEFRY